MSPVFRRLSSLTLTLCVTSTAKAQVLPSSDQDETEETETTESERDAPAAAPVETPSRRRGIGNKGFVAMEGLLFQSYVADFDTVDALGRPQKVRLRSSGFGLASPSWGVAGGYAVSNHFVIGARVTYEQSTLEDTGTAAGYIPTTVESEGAAFAPFLKAVFVKEGPVLPYVTATVGYKKITSKVNGTDVGGTDGLSYGGGLGLLLFPNRFFSIEPAANLIWNTLTDTSGTPVESTSRGIYITLSLSGWFGSDRAQPDRSSYSEETSDAPAQADSNELLELNIDEHPNRLDITIDPSDSRPQFVVSLSSAADDQEECDRLSLTSDDQSVTVPAQSHFEQGASSKRRVLVATVPYRALRHGTSEAKARVTACSLVWDLDGLARRKVLDYLVDFREQARVAGTLETARAMPLPEAPVPVDPSSSSDEGTESPSTSDDSESHDVN